MACGLISAFYPADDFAAEVDKVVSHLLSGPTVAFAKTKAAINGSTLGELEAALQRELEGQSVLLNSHDFREGARALQERRTANFTDS